MTWTIEFLDEAEKDLKKLDRSVRIQVVKGIRKVSQNPLSVQEGGYGKPLGNKTGNNLTNLLKIKFRDLGIRVVYKTIRLDNIMKIIVISARTDEQVYKEAGRRREKYGLSYNCKYLLLPDEALLTSAPLTGYAGVSRRIFRRFS